MLNETTAESEKRLNVAFLDLEDRSKRETRSTPGLQLMNDLEIKNALG